MLVLLTLLTLLMLDAGHSFSSFFSSYYDRVCFRFRIHVTRHGGFTEYALRGLDGEREGKIKREKEDVIGLPVDMRVLNL